MAESSSKAASGNKLGTALLLFVLILGGLACYYGWVRPFAGRNGVNIEVGLRIDPQRMFRDLQIK
jgi:hypothetical protein